MALLASPLGAQDLPTQLDFEFELGLGRRWLCRPSLLFLVVFLLVFLLVLLVLFFVHSVAMSTSKTQLQRFPCGRRDSQRCSVEAEQRAERILKNPIPLKRSYSSRGTRGYHNNSPAFLLPPVAKYLGSSEEEDRDSFSVNA